MKPDYDFAFGFLLVLLAGIIWGINVIFGFLTQEPIFLFYAVTSLTWFCFAPVFISKVLDPHEWAFFGHGYNLWSVVLLHLRKNPDGVAP